MIEVRDESRILQAPYQESRFGTYGTIVGVVVFLIFAVGLGYESLTGADFKSLFQTTPTHNFSKTYAYLGVPPIAILPQEAFDGLLALEKSPCDNEAIYSTAEAIAKTDKRWAADAYMGFASHCGRIAEGDFRVAASYYNDLNENEQALRAVEKAMPIGGTYDGALFYIKGLALAALGRHGEAITAYDTTFSILGKTKTRGQVFLDAATSYVALGRYCDALQIVRDNITSRPEDDLSQQRTLVGEYQQKCSPNDDLATVTRALR